MLEEAEKAALTQMFGRDEESSYTKWIYFFPHQFGRNRRTEVCQGFLCKVLNITRSKITTVQHKLANNKTLGDERGSTQERRIKSNAEELKNGHNEECKKSAL